MAAISTIDESTGSADDIEMVPAPKPPDKFIRHANLMSALTVVSRIFGLLRDKACATYLGNKTTEWSAFWMGFQLPNLFRRIFGEGALTAIFVPVYTKVRQEQGQEAANRLASATVTLLVCFLGGLTLVVELVMVPIAFWPSVSPADRLAAAMIAIMLPYCVLVCSVALLSAMATVHEKFAAQSISPIILNVFMTLAAALPVWLFTAGYSLYWRIFWVAGAVVLAGIVQVLQMLPTLRAAGIFLRPSLASRGTALGEIVKSMLPIALGLSAVQLNAYMDTQIAWWLSPDGHNKEHYFRFFGHVIALPLDTGAAGILSVAQRLYLLPVGIFGVSIATAIFPQMSKAVAQQDLPELKRLLMAGLRKTLFLSLPATVGMILIARPLITAIYSPKTPQELNQDAWTASWFCAGIWAFEAQMVILRAFYALSDRITPVKVAAAMVALNLSLNLTLVWFMQEGGIALSTTVSAAIQAAILLTILRRRLGDMGLATLSNSVGKGILATAVMAAAAYGLLHWLNAVHPAGGNRTTELMWIGLVLLPVVVGIAAATYGAMALALKMPELKDLPVVGRLLRAKDTGQKQENSTIQ